MMAAAAVSQEQIARFREEGYLVLEGFAEEAACLAVRERAEAIVAGFDFGGDISVFSTTEQSHAQDEYFLTSAYAVRCFLESGTELAELGEGEVPAVNKIGHALHDLDPVFEEFSYTSELARLLGELGYEQPAFIQSMYIFKSPGLGGEVVPHCDHSFLWTEPQSVCAFWFAIDDATCENGCLWVQPGGHRHPPKTRFRLEGAGTITDVLDDSPYDRDAFVPVEAPRGTLVVLHGQLPHFSEHNYSPLPRHAYTLHAIDTACEYLEDNWLQRGDTLRLIA